jgi:GGDEF domain-containing protein
MRMHLEDVERISNLRTHYAEGPGAAHLTSLQHAYDLYYERLNRRAVLTTIALIAATFLLFPLLALTLHRALGHIAGDRMLRIVGERLRHRVRQSDTVARFGGDEFVIVLERLTSVRAVATFAEKVIRSMSEPFQLSGRELFIGASVGVSLFPEDARKAEALIRNADVAMYQAKEGGRSAGCGGLSTGLSLRWSTSPSTTCAPELS